MATPLGSRLLADAKAALESRTVDADAQQTLDDVFKVLPVYYDDLDDGKITLTEWYLG